ncbi:hypothetical protein K458DRAFT_326482 [Lentithecium fluviatile CBS 122367]|uniref:BTB domain-containing protein n=1 Tax=Lentithecium fluviatile CBS 122367 TaxID=1168545 RepID=A0A6G1JKJ8_9PLEO|nr:hypothetical protein K458DRAFT_326482 [Lentithecium fluviatile CBS 122367]
MITSPEAPGTILDPNADTIIILKDHDADIAIWDDAAEFPRPPLVLPDAKSPALEQPNDTDSKEKSDSSSDTAKSEDAGIEEQPEAGLRFRVSSRHLSLASPYFLKNLSAKWDQHPRDEKGRVILTELYWSKPAFARLMFIFHGRTRAVERTLDLVELAEMACLVDYYDCAEVVEVYSQGWINHLKKGLPGSYDRDAVLWMCIAWVFGVEEVFQWMTLVAQRECRGEMQTMGLPIPEAVVAAVEQSRQDYIARIMASIDEHLGKLLDGKAGCSFTCASIHLGFFTKALHVRGLRSPTFVHPYQGVSIQMLVNALREIGCPKWCVGDEDRYCEMHTCTQRNFMPNLATEVGGRAAGFLLSNFPSHHKNLGMI